MAFDKTSSSLPRGLGLDCGPMSGILKDEMKIFFEASTWKTNFICALGHGRRNGLFPPLPRLPLQAPARFFDVSNDLPRPDAASLSLGGGLHLFRSAPIVDISLGEGPKAVFEEAGKEVEVYIGGRSALRGPADTANGCLRNPLRQRNNARL